MSVSAIIVTRGDVDLAPCWASMPEEWEKIVWSNSMGWARVERAGGKWAGELHPVPDLSVYGRYAAIEYASHDLIYVQDDDVIVSDPQAIVDAYPWEQTQDWPDGAAYLVETDAVVCNMPQEFRHEFYTDQALVGFGAAFHRDAPDRAFALMMGGEDIVPPFFTDGWVETFNRCCDVVFTALTPRVLVDVPKENLPWAEDYSRMYRQPNHTTERMQMLELARRVRDAK